jgi:sugar O-acyltransferase (sialic acid O-acetyltransferase NeuD family)
MPTNLSWVKYTRTRYDRKITNQNSRIFVMLVAGAARHAKDLLTVLEEHVIDYVFFDDTATGLSTFEGYPIIGSLHEAKNHFEENGRAFALATGAPKSRAILNSKLEQIGGRLCSVISSKAIIGKKSTYLGEGLNVLPYAFISNCVNIGKGTLLNVGAYVHHDCYIGEFCELSPGCKILGGVHIGDFSSIGANATILPDIKVGSNVAIGAGAVVTKDIEDGAVVAGVPGKVLRYNMPI